MNDFKNIDQYFDSNGDSKFFLTKKLFPGNTFGEIDFINISKYTS